MQKKQILPLISPPGRKAWLSRLIIVIWVAALPVWGLFSMFTLPVSAAPLFVAPTSTRTPKPTSTRTPKPTSTRTPKPTSTRTPTPTINLTPATSTLTSTATSISFQLGDIIINEVAWGGTKASKSGEWIELYNSSVGGPIVLSDGWKLQIIGGSAGPVTINLGTGVFQSPSTTCPISTGGISATIPSNGYFLLEASNDDTICDIAADQFFKPGIPDDGRIIYLIDPSNKIIDTANVDGGAWPAGKKSTTYGYCSMERGGVDDAPDIAANWITNDGQPSHINGLDANLNKICGTPKNPNWASTVTATFTPTPTRTPKPTKTRTPGPTPKPSATHKPTKTLTPTPAPLLVSNVVINEFLTLPRSDWNHDGKVDIGDGFIEIKNVSTVAGSLSGYYLDDATGDSSPFYLPSVTIEAGARLVYFNSETHIFLSSGGDDVRLFKPGGILDVFTYTSVPIPGQSWCRLPDGSPTWVFGCEPTPQEANHLAQNQLVEGGQEAQSKLCESKTILPVLYQAECTSSGLEIWSRSNWLGELQIKYPLYIQQDEQEFIIE
jgi:hypothetical protein